MFNQYKEPQKHPNQKALGFFLDTPVISDHEIKVLNLISPNEHVIPKGLKG